MKRSNFALGLGVCLVFAAVSAAAVAGEEVSPNAQKFWNASGAVGALANQDDMTIHLENSMTAELYADTMLTSVSVQRVFRNTLPSIANYSQTAHRQINSNFCGTGSKWVMWDTPWLQRDVRERSDGYLGYDQYSSGFATGLSYLFGPNAMLGLAVGYDARKQVGKDGYYQKARSDAFHSALYGGTALGCFFIDGYLGFSWASTRTEKQAWRQSPLQPADLSLNRSAGYYNNIFSAGLKASYVFILGQNTRITPSLGLDYSRVHQSAFSERMEGTGNSLLGVDAASYNALQMPIKVALTHTFSSDFLTFGGVRSLWSPELRAGWVPEFGAKHASVAAVNYAPAIPGRNHLADANSSPRLTSYGTVGAGLKIQLRDKYIFGVDYDFSFGNDYRQHVVTGTYGVCF